MPGKAHFNRGLGKIARERQSFDRIVPNQQEQLIGFYTGIVMDDTDDQRMGQIWVYIGGVSARRFNRSDALPAYGATTPDRINPGNPNNPGNKPNPGSELRWDQQLRLGWIQCYPMLPFFGGDDYRVERSPDGDIRSARNGDVQTYGFWAQPRTGDRVGVLFANGDPQKGYWVGMIPDFNRNFMVPGSPGRPPADLDEKNDPDGVSIHKETARFKVEAPEESLVPAMDKTERISNDENNPVERELIDVLVSPEFATNTQKAGLLCDPLRGAGNSSSRRESPSYVLGIKSAGWNFDSEKKNLNTAGGSRQRFDETGTRLTDVATSGHQLTFDDHPDFQGVRLRTSAGSQLYFQDRCDEPFIYISTAKGNMWIEMIDDGKINIFAEGSVSIHAREDINLTADRDINIDAQRDLNLQVRRNTNVALKGTNQFEFGKNDLPPQDLKYDPAPTWGKNSALGQDTRDTLIKSAGNVDITVGTGPNPSQTRDLCLNVTKNADWTVGGSLKMSVGSDPTAQSKDFDITVGGNTHLTSSFDVDITATQGMHLQAVAGTMDISSALTTHIQSGLQLNLLASGDILLTGLPNIHLNGPPASPAFPAVPAEPAGACSEPTIPGTGTTFRVPTDQEVKDCVEPPSEFRTIFGMSVPQHQPYPGRCESSRGLSGFVDESATSVSRVGGTTLDSLSALNLPQENFFRQGLSYTSNNIAEVANYDNLPPQGEFSPCSTYTTSDRGIEFLHVKEGGFQSKAYPDADGYSIGFGHFIKIGDTINGDTIQGVVTEEDLCALRRFNGDLNIPRQEGDRLFALDLQKFEQAVCRQTTTNITQGQFDAMVSYSYNGGEGALRRMIQRSSFNSGDFSKVPQAWMRLSTCSRCDPSIRTRVEIGLRRRRREELELLFAQV